MIRFILGLLLAMGAVESEASLLVSTALASAGLLLALSGALKMHKSQASLAHWNR